LDLSYYIRCFYVGISIFFPYNSCNVGCTVIKCTQLKIIPDNIFLVVRDSSVGIATRYGLDGPGIEYRCRARFSAPVQIGPGAHPASYTMGTGSFPGVKRPGRGVDHSPPFSAEVKEK
jgi:hypothetical protein